MEIYEVRDMFERIATAFVGLSETARQVDGLRQELGNLRDELESVKLDRNNAYEMLHKVSFEKNDLAQRLDAANHDNERERQHVEYLNGLLVSRDTRVVELERSLAQRQDDIDHLRSENDLLNGDVARLQGNLDSMIQERDHWKDALNKVQETIRPLFGNLTQFPNVGTPPNQAGSTSTPGGGSEGTPDNHTEEPNTQAVAQGW